jgi:hypothetical protein
MKAMPPMLINKQQNVRMRNIFCYLIQLAFLHSY